MDQLIDLYQRKLNLPRATFTSIDHEDTMVAPVFKISQADSPDLILKVCSQKHHFLREVYFLSRFAGKIPVPRIIQLVEPEVGIDGAVLMECVPGELLKSKDVTTDLAFKIGALLAHIHLEQVESYGDLTNLADRSADPRISFTVKFEEGLAECKGHLPEKLLQACRDHFNKDIDLLLCADGPCIIHRDFRLGNLIVYEGKVRGIIDWSSARGGFAEDDFYSLAFGEWPQECEHSFLAGYASMRKVPNYQSLMPLLRLSRAVGAIGFTVKKGTWQSKSSQFYQLHRRYLESLISLNH